MADQPHDPSRESVPPPEEHTGEAEQVSSVEHPEAEIRYPDGQVEHPGVGYEPKDIRLDWIVGLLVAGGVVMTIAAYLAWRFLRAEEGFMREYRSSPYAQAPLPSTALPPEPRLEELNRMDKVERANVFLRQLAKEKVLNRYGPTEEKGFVHIPIQEAIRAVAEGKPGGKLPVKTQPEVHSRGLLDAGEPNSGRVFRGELP